MGFYVHIHVAFSCDRYEALHPWASKHLPSVKERAESDNGDIEGSIHAYPVHT